MNQSLVMNIRLPDDGIFEQSNPDYKENAKEYITKQANQGEVEFVIDNLNEAVAAAHDDFCCNGNDRHYFKVDTGKGIYEITFDLASLKHLFGVFGDSWQRTELYNQLRNNHPELRKAMNDGRLSWLDKMAKVYNPIYKSEIINHECSDRNSLIKKLNYQKMMIKIFLFINAGKLEEGITSMYREKYRSNNPHYLLVRSLRNGELENIANKDNQYYNKELCIVLVEEVYNGQKCLTPKSIYIDDKPLYRDGSRNKSGGKIKEYQGKEYIYFSTPTITRLEGGKYVNKGAR